MNGNEKECNDDKCCAVAAKEIRISERLVKIRGLSYKLDSEIDKIRNEFFGQFPIEPSKDTAEPDCIESMLNDIESILNENLKAITYVNSKL